MSDLFSHGEGPLWGVGFQKPKAYGKSVRQHFFSIIRTRLRDKKLLLQAAETQNWCCAYCDQDLVKDPYDVAGTIEAEADHVVALSAMFRDTNQIVGLLAGRQSDTGHSEYEAAIGRANNIDNIIASCKPCNLRRGDQDALSFWRSQQAQAKLVF